MKVIKDIAVAELKKLFFSPVAFLILVIFSFLLGSIFTGSFSFLMMIKSNGFEIDMVTAKLFTANMTGFYEPLRQFIYLFIPLLTMNIISKDLGSGAFKLLLSSPVKNRQIILGKYMSLVVFSFIMLLLIMLFSVYGISQIEQVDLPLALSGLLGLFLLCCTYAAIGVFMSSLTTYRIVAAIGTLTILMFLNYVDGMWQEYPVVRDITYWLSINGRAKIFIKGMITSEDLIYFIALIGFFLSIALIRLRASRIRRSRFQLAGQYVVSFLVLFMIGYYTSMPKFKVYFDMSRNKFNTLSAESQKVVEKLDGGLTITTYTNMLDDTYHAALPSMYKKDVERFEKYLRFKPEIRMKYVYYYKKVPGGYYDKTYPNMSDKEIMDTVINKLEFSFNIVPYESIKDQVDLSGEKYRFVRLIERENGQKTFLRYYDDTYKHPAEAEITAALKRVAEPLPKVGFVTGHGERTGKVENDRGYSMFAEEKVFRYSLINNGFDFEDVSLMAPVPDHISILVIADARKTFSETEMLHYKAYIARGGNLLLAGDPGRQDVMNTVTAPLGVSLLPGRLVHSNPKLVQDVLALTPEADSKWENRSFKLVRKNRFFLMLNGATALTADSSSGYTKYALFTTDSSDVWNEMETTNFLDDSAVVNAAAGEVRKPYTVVMALEKSINGKKQRVIVSGDADWISNSGLSSLRKEYTAANFMFLVDAFYWMSDNKVPINTQLEPATDKGPYTDKKTWKVMSVVLKWTIPVLLLIAGIFMWVRRKGR